MKVVWITADTCMSSASMSNKDMGVIEAIDESRIGQRDPVEAIICSI